eukprot:TRINITY_DN4855_c0_g1_i5.p1 TRINITY_DN4855_c0_g1~~TRINITY_DN4855_c0_g1_i5.p1  ORF type:complete len:225 (+),score=33.27 TRINITY_DN4855_c0_g1_i5:62-736(+)
MDVEKRQPWNGIVDVVFCGILITAAVLSYKKEFMQVREVFDEPVYWMSVEDTLEHVDDLEMVYNAMLKIAGKGSIDLASKVKATMAGIALMFAFCGMTIIATLAAYVAPYRIMKTPLKIIPMLTIIAGIISATGATFLFIEIADVSDEGDDAKIRPYIGFVCCLAQSILSFFFLCARSFYKPIRNMNHQPQSHEMGKPMMQYNDPHAPPASAPAHAAPPIQVQL